MIKESTGKICEGIYALGNPDLPAFLFGGEIPALFDAGMTFMGPIYLQELKTYLGDAGKLRYLLLTHSHFDHCGGAPFLKRKIPGLKIGTSRLAAEVFQRPNAVQLIQSLNQYVEDQFNSPNRGEDVSFHSLEVDLVLEDRRELILGDERRVQVIATPGHTRDAVSFYIPEWKALIPGEVAGVYDRNLNILPEFLSSFEGYMASLEKLSALDLDLLLLGHSFVVTGEDARGYIGKSIEATKRFKKRIEDLLDMRAGEQEAVVKIIFQEDYEGQQAIP